LVPGTDFDYSFTFYQGSQPIDLTGASAAITIDDGQGDVLFSINSSSVAPATSINFGGTTGDPTNGIVAIHITAADIASFIWNYENFVLTITTEALGFQTVITGSFAVVGFLPQQ
jgi:hypothetical protein